MAQPNTLTVTAGPSRVGANAVIRVEASHSSTGNTQTTPFKGVGGWSSASVILGCSAFSTSVLNVWIQKRAPDSTSWIDIIAFKTLTATGSITAEFTSAGNDMFTPTDGTLAAGTIQTCMIGSEWAISWSVGNDTHGGTATFAIYADFYE